MKPKSLCLLTCASFARETAALAGEADLVQVVFGIYPNRCGRPPLSWEEVRSVVGPPEQCAAIRIFGGCCLAALGDPPPDLAHCTVTRLENCFELVADQRTVAGLTASGSYLVSAGWLAQLCSGFLLN